MTSCERDLQSLYALASSNRSIPSSVSRARKPSPVVLSTLGIGNRNHSTRKKAARIAQILPPIRPSHTPCSPRRPARATVSRTALVPPYVPDITARSGLVTSIHAIAEKAHSRKLGRRYRYQSSCSISETELPVYGL